MTLLHSLLDGFLFWIENTSRRIEVRLRLRREWKAKRRNQPLSKTIISGRGIFIAGEVFTDSQGLWRVTKRTQRSDHVEYHAEKVV